MVDEVGSYSGFTCESRVDGFLPECGPQKGLIVDIVSDWDDTWYLVRVGEHGLVLPYSKSRLKLMISKKVQFLLSLIKE